MRYLAINLVLALVWMFLSGDFSTLGLVFGFLLAFLVLVASQPVLGSRRYVRAVFSSIHLAGVFLYELVAANLQLAKDVLSPVPPLKPAFVAFAAPELREGQAVLLGHLVSLTPGTLTVDYDPTLRTLYIHTVYGQAPERLQQTFTRFATLIQDAAGGPRDREGGIS
jgi:multicomponent Na+:H+ antiporter subunit E